MTADLIAMQLLTFTISGQSYAIPSKRVIEVLPLIPARPVPGMPEYIAGLFTYRGQLLPLVDLGKRIASASPARRLSTRVIVVEFPPAAATAGTAAALVRMGLVAENVVSIRSVSSGVPALTTMALPNAPYLGPILRLEGRTGADTSVQLIELERLLPDDLLQGLFPDPMAPDHARE